MPKQLLVLDIGGSKTRAAIYSVLDNNFKKEHYEKLITAHIEDISDFIEKFLQANSSYSENDTSLLIAAAGPKRQDCIVLHNANLKICLPELKRRFGFENILLMNDMVAAASRINSQYHRIEKQKLFMDGTFFLEESRFIMISPKNNEGVCDEKAPLAVIRAGTGLGAAAITEKGGNFVTIASEAARLPAESMDEEDADFIRYIFERKGRIATLEDMSSGMGMEDYYNLITSNKKSAKQMTYDSDEDVSSAQAIRFFLKNQGRFAAALCNIFLPYKGIIATGNILTGNRHLIEESGLNRDYEAYANIPGYEQIPVILYAEHDVNLKGCLEIAANRMGIENIKIS